MDRRKFVKLCAGSAAMLAAGRRVAHAGDFSNFSKVRLTDAQGAPLKASALTSEEAYVFHFPFRSIPCFLINLGKRASGPQAMTSEGGDFTWPGGVGKDGNIVSYMAVCSHQLSFPGKEGSVIRYASKGSEIAGKNGMIVCCAHASVFDPAIGAKRVHGEATDPLVTVRLEYDAKDDGLYATGLSGLHLVERFFNVHKRSLIAEYGPGVYRESVGESSPAVPLSKYAASVSNC